MPDTQPCPAAAGLVEVADHIELGRLIADWALREDARPNGVADLVRQLDGIARVAPTIAGVEFVQGRERVLVINLPEKGLMERRMRELESPLVGDRYRLPRFYDDIYRRHFGPEMAPLDIFLARMGDDAIAQCR